MGTGNSQYLLIIVQSFLAIVGFIFLIVQIKQREKSSQMDIDWRKRQSTIDFYQKTCTEINFYLDWIEAKGKSLDPELDKLFTDDTPDPETLELRKNIVIFLSRLRWLDVGIEHGVYDFDTLNKIGGSYLKRKYNQFKKFMVRVNRDPENDVYAEAKHLIEKFNESSPEQTHV